MDKITAVIITKDEERNILRCLKSLENVADEIIVVDSFSSDQTKSICESQHVRFEQQDWLGYSATKNIGNALASNPYILSIDADEAISPALETSIIEAKTTGLAGTYSFNRLTNYCGKWIRHGGWYPDTKLRLFPTAGSNWQGEIHEQLTFAQDLKNTLLKGDLHHYSYYSFAEHRERADKYSILTAKKLYLAGKRVTRFKPWISFIGRFFGMYLMKGAILDGYYGFKISLISAQSNVLKYNELLRLQSGEE